MHHMLCCCQQLAFNRKEQGLTHPGILLGMSKMFHCPNPDLCTGHVYHRDMANCKARDRRTIDLRTSSKPAATKTVVPSISEGDTAVDLHEDFPQTHGPITPETLYDWSETLILSKHFYDTLDVYMNQPQGTSYRNIVENELPLAEVDSIMSDETSVELEIRFHLPEGPAECMVSLLHINNKFHTAFITDDF